MTSELPFDLALQGFADLNPTICCLSPIVGSVIGVGSVATAGRKGLAITSIAETAFMTLATMSGLYEIRDLLGTALVGTLVIGSLYYLLRRSFIDEP